MNGVGMTHPHSRRIMPGAVEPVQRGLTGARHTEHTEH
jgi:hypothetical protein